MAKKRQPRSRVVAAAAPAEPIMVMPRSRRAGAEVWQDQGRRHTVRVVSSRQKKSMHYSRHVAAILRSSIDFGNALGSVRWKPMVLGPDGLPTPTKDPVLSDYAASLNVDTRWANRLGRQLHDAGEGWLTVRWADGLLDWSGHSVKEITDEGNGKPLVFKRNQQDQGRPLAPGVDAIRVWFDDADWPTEPWTPLMSDQGLMVAANVLALEALISASHKSQLNAGILKIPAEMFGALKQLLITYDEDGKPLPISDQDVLSRFLSYFEDAADLEVAEQLTPLDRLVPLLAVAPGESLGALDHVSLKARFDSAEAIAMQERDLRTLALLLPSPQSVLIGLSGNHWTAKLEKDSDAQRYWEPAATVISSAVTTQHLRRFLMRAKDNGLWDGNPMTALIVPDVSDLVQNPTDWKQDLELAKSFMIAPRTVRERLNYSEDDAPTPAEVKWLQDALAPLTQPMATPNPQKSSDTRIMEPVRPTVTTNEQPAQPMAAAFTPEAMMDAFRTVLAEHTAVTAAAAPGPSWPGLDDINRRLAAVDERLLGRLIAINDLAVDSALKEAGYLIRRKATTNPWSDRVRSAAAPGTDPTPLAYLGALDEVVHPADFATVILPMIEKAGADTEKAVLAAYDEAWDVLAQAGVEEPEKKRKVLILIERTRAAAAGRLIAERIRARLENWLARTRQQKTETPPRLEPAEIQAVVAEGGGGAYTITADGNAVPESGSATVARSREIEAILADMAPERTRLVREYQWVLGHPQQPYPAHTVLATGQWLRSDSFDGQFPGDHHGCQCRIDSRLVLEPLP